METKNRAQFGPNGYVLADGPPLPALVAGWATEDRGLPYLDEMDGVTNSYAEMDRAGQPSVERR